MFMHNDLYFCKISILGYLEIILQYGGELDKAV